MKILFAAHENAWGGFLGLLKTELSQHEFEASGRFGFETLKGFDVLIPTMSVVNRDHLAGSDRLQLIQQSGAGLDGVDLQAASEMNIRRFRGRVGHIHDDRSIKRFPKDGIKSCQQKDWGSAGKGSKWKNSGHYWSWRYRPCSGKTS